MQKAPFYFNPREDEYVSKVARTIEEARMLVEAGFEYVCDATWKARNYSGSGSETS